MIAVCMIRREPHYRREAFEHGLARAGYSIKESGRPSSPDDILLIWNRYGAQEGMARTWESVGGTVIVCENGYIGTGPLYAIAAHGHNGSGWHPVFDDGRFQKLGIDVKPWRESGGHTLICGQRGIGSKEMASPDGWHLKAQRKLPASRPVKVRLHPGNDAPKTRLDNDLDGAHSCVVWSSASGVRAMTLGIPVFYDAPHWICEDAALPLRSSDIERPLMNDQSRAKALASMACAQHSISEIESGEPFVRMREMEWGRVCA